MSKASSTADAKAESWTERWQHWIAVLSSALLHLLLLLLVMLTPPITVAPPQGAAAGGSRMAVDFIGATTPQPTLAPPVNKPPTPKTAKKKAPASRVQATRVVVAEDPLPPDEEDEATQARAPAAAPPPTPQRRPHIWGQPPGMLPQDTAPENAGLARSPSIDRGSGNNASGNDTSLEVGGYQVYYDLRNDIKLRAWRDQGMTEIFLPLPGIRQYMVCPLETALRRESGPCRLLEPNAPELKAIGDARDVIDMQKVYRRGELVWSGPGLYR
jgi:hypothetical protein